MNEGILVRKADGTTEPFSEDKLRHSLQEARAKDPVIEEIVSHIKEELRPGIKTSSIYNHAFSLLKKHGGASAARYSLRRSLADLGPTGFPFEHFVARLFEAQGYSTQVGIHLTGACVKHEVDVVAKKEGDFVIGEVKFHNEHNIKSDVKTALYVSARFDDLEKSNFDNLNTQGAKPRRILITNTKFTSKAIRFGECADLDLIGWGYPEKGNLEDLITQANLQPVTALTTLSNKDKKKLLDNELVLCKSLRENEKALEQIGMPPTKINTVMGEVDGLCHL